MMFLLAFSLALPAQASPAPEHVLRSYDLRFLVEEVPRFPSPYAATAGTLDLLDAYTSGDGISHFGASEEDVFDSRGIVGAVFDIGAAERGVRLDPQSIVDMIRSNIDEDSWSHAENNIEVQGHELVVTQTANVHARVEALLSSLRARRALLYAVEVALVPPAVLVGIGSRDQPWLEAGALDAALKAAGAAGRRISLVAYNEQLVSGHSGRLRTTVVDGEINQTGVAPVMNPVVVKLPIGLSCEVQPLAIAGSDWVRLRLQVTKLEEAGETKRLLTPFLQIEAVPLRQESTRAALLLRPGRAVVAASFREEGAGGRQSEFAVLAELKRVDLEAPAAEAAPTADFQLQLHDVRFLLEFERRGSSASTESSSSGFDATDDEDIMLKLIRTNVTPEAWRDDRAGLRLDAGFLHATARAATHAALREWIDAAVRRRAHLVTLDVEVLQAPLGALLELRRKVQTGAVLPEDWRSLPEAAQAKSVFRARAAGLLSSRLRASGYEARPFLADVSVVSGGTGFSVIEMPDPVVLSAGSGFELAAEVSPLLRPDVFRLDLELKQCRVRFDRKAEFVARAAVGKSEHLNAPEGSSGLRLLPVRVPYSVDLPEQESPTFRFSGVLPQGHTVVLGWSRDRGRDDGRLVLAALRVHDASEGR